MNVQRFEGRDMAAVLAQIRRELGADAVIVSTRTRRGEGLGGRLRRRQMVEVIAGLPEPSVAPVHVPGPVPVPEPVVAGETSLSAQGLPAQGLPAQGLPAQGLPARSVPAQGRGPSAVPSAIPSLAERFLQDAGAGALSAAAPGTAVGSRSRDRLEISSDARLAAYQAQIATPATTARAAPEPARPETPVAGPGPGPAANAVAEEIRSLRAEIAGLRQMMAPPPTPIGQATGGAGLPPAAQSLLDRLRAGGASEAFVERTAATVRGTLGADSSAEAGRAAVLRALLSQLPSGTPAAIPLGSAAGVVLVGASGTGKTLSAVKLARALQQSGHEVLLANADQQRPGAGAQLSAYGEALGIAVAQIYAPADLRALVATRPGTVLVVDTAGGLPAGSTALALRALVQELPAREVLLTVSATSGAGEMLRAQAAFAALSPDGLIVSQADEALGFGATVSFLGESTTPLFYLSQHADVLRPLEAASPATLLERVLQQGREEVRDEALAG